MTDTSTEVEQRYQMMLMECSPEQRLVMGARMFDTARALVLASLPPGCGESERRRMLFARLYPELVGDQIPPAFRAAE